MELGKRGQTCRWAAQAIPKPTDADSHYITLPTKTNIISHPRLVFRNPRSFRFHFWGGYLSSMECIQSETTRPSGSPLKCLKVVTNSLVRDSSFRKPGSSPPRSVEPCVQANGARDMSRSGNAEQYVCRIRDIYYV